MNTGGLQVAEPKVFHGVGPKAHIYDDGFLRTLVDSPVRKVWSDDRDWRHQNPAAACMHSHLTTAYTKARHERGMAACVG